MILGGCQPGAVLSAEGEEGTLPPVAADAREREIPMNGLSWFLAARSGNVEALEAMVAEGTPVDQTGPGNETALMAAAALGRTDAVAFLAEAGAELDRQDRAGFTALAHAVVHEQNSTSKLLLQLGASPHIPSAEGNAPLMFAAGGTSPTMVRILLDGGAEIDQTNASFGAGPLLQSMEGGNQEIVEVLLARGADIEQRDRYDWSPLRKAAFLGHTMLVRRLMEAGADPARKDRNGWAAIHWSVVGQHEDILHILRDHVSPDSRTDEGKTPLMLAAERGFETMVLALMKAGADPDLHVTEEGVEITAAMLAARNGHSAIEPLLQQHRATD